MNKSNQSNQIERRRFYLSKSNLDYLDRLAMLHQTSSSKLLDTLIEQLQIREVKSNVSR